MIDYFVNLVTPAEAVRLTNYRTTADIRICEQITAAYHKSIAAENSRDSFYSYYKFIATIWNAGRLQGIREERLKKNMSKKELIKWIKKNPQLKN